MCQISWTAICKLITLLVFQTRESEAAVVNRSQNDPVIWLDRLAGAFRFIDQKDSAVLSELCLPAFSEVRTARTWTRSGCQNLLTFGLFSGATGFIQSYGSLSIERSRDGTLLPVHTVCDPRSRKKWRFRFAIISRESEIRFYLWTRISQSTVLTSYSGQLVELYRVNGHSCFLYLGSILVDEYGNDSSNWDVILRMIHAFVEPTCALLPDENSFRDHPDTIEDLFRLCSRLVILRSCIFENRTKRLSKKDLGL